MLNEPKVKERCPSCDAAAKGIKYVVESIANAIKSADENNPSFEFVRTIDTPERG